MTGDDTREAAPRPLFIDTREAATHLRVTVFTVRRWLRAGILPEPDTRVGLKYLWNRERFLAWLEAREAS